MSPTQSPSLEEIVPEPGWRRAADLVFACVLLLGALPFALPVSLALCVESRGPLFFLQTRHGQGFRAIRIYKFRTLRHGQPDPFPGYEMQSDDPRITRVGAFLRRTSLDELPQLLNVLRGDMSLVGPRPLDTGESRRCLAAHAERFAVRPGLTGLAQVSGRNGLPFDRRAELDVEYVRRRSARLDLEILLRTPAVMISGRGLYPTSQGTG